MQRSGSSIERGTEPIAARWNTTRAPSIASASAAGSRIDACTNDTRSGNRSMSEAMASGSAFDRSSITRTRAPSSARAPTRCDPMNPAPPVTQTRRSPSAVSNRSVLEGLHTMAAV
jgi:hypothetical protein